MIITDRLTPQIIMNKKTQMSKRRENYYGSYEGKY